MARPRRIDPLIEKRAQLAAATSTSVESLRQCQAVLLPALFGATLEQTANVLAERLPTPASSVDYPAGRHGIECQPGRCRWREVTVDINDQVRVARGVNRNLSARTRHHDRRIGYDRSG